MLSGCSANVMKFVIESEALFVILMGVMQGERV
jgi:hypothetical protein